MEMFKDRKYTFLVTGGAGFIGSNLCDVLLKHGNRVICLDDFSTGKMENINAFLSNDHFKLLTGDIRDYKTCETACEGVDFVLHQAAWGSVPRSIKHPLIYQDVNIGGTLNIFEAALKQGVKRCVYASSSSVYGDSLDLPKVEGKTGKTLSPYALTKSVCEEYGRLYKQLYDFDTYGLRYFNVFGQNQNPDGDYAAVIPKFAKLLSNNIAPTIYGDGSQTRDFTHINNVVQANIKACFAPREYAGEVFNVAYGGVRLSLIDIYKEICAALGKEIEPIFAEPRKGDIKDSAADVSKAKKCLGYQPEIDFTTGLNMTIDWYKSI